MSRACSALRHVLSSEQKNEPSLNGEEREHTDAGERGLMWCCTKGAYSFFYFSLFRGESWGRLLTPW